MKLVPGLVAAGALALGVAAAQQRTPPSGAAARADAGTAAAAGPQAGGPCGCMMMMAGAPMGPGMMQGGRMGPGVRMHPDGGMPMGRMGAGPMQCPGMQAIGSVRAENTQDGAVLRLTATSPAQAAQVQEHARMMATCMSAHLGAQGAAAGAADAGTR